MDWECADERAGSLPGLGIAVSLSSLSFLHLLPMAQFSFPSPNNSDVPSPPLPACPPVYLLQPLSLGPRMVKTTMDSGQEGKESIRFKDDQSDSLGVGVGGTKVRKCIFFEVGNNSRGEKEESQSLPGAAPAICSWESKLSPPYGVAAWQEPGLFSGRGLYRGPSQPLGFAVNRQVKFLFLCSLFNTTNQYLRNSFLEARCQVQGRRTLAQPRMNPKALALVPSSVAGFWVSGIFPKGI